MMKMKKENKNSLKGKEKNTRQNYQNIRKRKKNN